MYNTFLTDYNNGYSFKKSEQVACQFGHIVICTKTDYMMVFGQIIIMLYEYMST